MKLVSLSGQTMKGEIQGCDKCGKPVPNHNDAVALDIEMGGAIRRITAQPRHLLPVEGCTGSPSRAQYLPGQPRDHRYPYNEAYEPLVREAYAKMQECK